MKNIPIENLNEKKQTLKTPIKNDIDLIDTMKENENDENLKNLIEKNTKESNWSLLLILINIKQK